MTELFSISTYFTGTTAEVIRQAVKNSTLPEGVSIVSKSEYKNAKKPFVVIAHAGYTNEAIEVMKAGGDYIEMIENADKLTERLNG